MLRCKNYIIIFFLCFLSNSYGQDCGSSFDCWRAKGILLFEQKEYESATSAFRLAKTCANVPLVNDIPNWIEKIRAAQISTLDGSRTGEIVGVRGLRMPESGMQTQWLNQGIEQYVKGEYQKAIDYFVKAGNATNGQEVNEWLERAAYGQAAGDLFKNGLLDSAKYMYIRVKTPFENDFAESRLSEIEHIWSVWSPLKTLYPDTLNLSNTSLTGIPSEIGLQSQLQLLDLSQNKISYLPSKMIRLNRLHTLKLNRNQFVETPISISLLSGLQTLELAENRIRTISPKLFTLKKLKQLDISYNQIRALPNEISGLAGLEELYLDNNQLLLLPEGISGLKNLKILSFSGNQIHELPPNIKGLALLEELDWSDNGYIKNPGRDLTAFPLLKSIDCSNNSFLSSLSEGFGSLNRLEQVRMSHCNLTEVPASLGKLSALKNLDLEGNLLSILPENISNLYRLEILDLSNNHLHHLPTSLGSLSALQELNLSGNSLLQSLPQSIKNCTHLRELDLRNTGISPEQLSKYKSLLPKECVVLY